jgi:hypothetical protein
MGIKITYKKKVPLSNEPQTTLKSAGKEQGKTNEVNTTTQGPIPFIDKISVVMDVPVEMGNDSYTAIMVQTKDTDLFKSSQHKAPFNRAWRIAINCTPNSIKWPVLMASFDMLKKQALKFRVEFSPVDIGVEGMEELHAALMMLMDGGWKSFAEHGRVTMIEITVDLPGIGVDQFDVIPKQAVYRQAWGKNGHLETIVLGKAKGNQTKIYNRGKKRTDKGQKWHGPITTRIERRLRPQGLKLTALPTIPNPFAGIILPASNLPAPPKEPASTSYLWTMFQDSIKSRGLAGALNLLPEARRTRYRAWLKQHPEPWWSPQVIWSHWPKYITDLRISDPQAWK